jgi:hypothetical protein
VLILEWTPPVNPAEFQWIGPVSTEQLPPDPQLQNQLAAIIGPPGQSVVAGGVTLNQVAPAAFWSFPNPTGRLATISVFTSAGEEVEADVVCTVNTITITFANAISGSLVVN